MPMAPDDIRAELIRRGITQTEIADALGRSQGYVGNVIAGRRRDHDIEVEIAARIGKPVHRVFAKDAA